MKRLEKLFGITFLGLILFSSCEEGSMKNEVTRINEQKSLITNTLNKLASTNSLEEYTQLLSGVPFDKMALTVDRESLNADEKLVFDSLQNSVVEFLEDTKYRIDQMAVTKSITLVDEEDVLLPKGEKQFAVFLYKGDEIYLNFSAENSATEVSIVNQETQNVVFSKKGEKLQEKIFIRFPSLYLITIQSSVKQYADVKIERKAASMETFTASTAVISDTVLCEKTEL